VPDADLTKRILKAVDDGFDDEVALHRRFSRACRRCAGGGAGAGPDGGGQCATAAGGRPLEKSRSRIQEPAGFSRWRCRYDDAWNVVGAHRRRRRRAIALILNGHIDVVRRGRWTMWSSPPFERGSPAGWMYGRGAGDMKAGLAANLAALDAPPASA